MAVLGTSPRRWALFVAAQVRQGGRRVRGSALAIVQASMAAAAAYLIAEQFFGRANPMFAPIACWVCLGFKTDRVPRKVAELGVGATVGVLLGEAFALGLEVGWWQIGVALFVGAIVGRFLDRGDMTTIQAGVNAVVVIGMSWWQALAGGVTGRWIDALVGAGVAFVVAVLLPRHPTARPRRYARSTLTEYATLLGMVGRGLRTGDMALLQDAQGQRRAVAELTSDWEETLTTAREVVALNPGLRRYRPEVAELSRIFRLTRRMQRSSYLLARQGLGMAEEVGPMPDVGEMLLDVSTAIHALVGSIGQWNQPHRARELLLGVAGRAAPAEVEGLDWRPIALMSLMRSIVVDLLQMTGLSRAQARDALVDTWGRPFEDRDPELSRADSDDDASSLWG